MQDTRMPNRVITLLMLGALAAAPLAAPAEETTETEAPAVEAPATETPVPEAVLEDAEAQARLRQELEQREAERAQLRQQNCEQARTQLQQIVDMPPRNVRQTLEDGTISRMTEEEHKAHIEKLRAAEAENCD